MDITESKCERVSKEKVTLTDPSVWVWGESEIDALDGTGTRLESCLSLQSLNTHRHQRRDKQEVQHTSGSI